MAVQRLILIPKIILLILWGLLMIHYYLTLSFYETHYNWILQPYITIVLVVETWMLICAGMITYLVVNIMDDLGD